MYEIKDTKKLAQRIADDYELLLLEYTQNQKILESKIRGLEGNRLIRDKMIDRIKKVVGIKSQELKVIEKEIIAKLTKG